MAKIKSPRETALLAVEQLRYHSKMNNLSDQLIADELGVSRQCVSKQLSGQVVPRLDTFIGLCRVIGWEPEDFTE